MSPGPRNRLVDVGTVETAFNVGAGAATAGEAPSPESPVLIVNAVDGAAANLCTD